MWSERLRRGLRRTGNAWLPQLWQRLRLTGRRPSRPAATWHSPGGQHALIVAPHPDDELAGCGGTLLRHLAAGDRVTVAVVTDGRRSRAIDDPPRMAAARHREALVVAGLTGATLHWLGLPEGEWRTEELTPLLRSRLETLSPDVLYVPSRVDFHPEHRRVAHACAQALATGRAPAAVRIFEVQVPLGSLANLVCDVSRVAAPCRRALRGYASQWPALDFVERRWAYTARRHGRTGAAEVFLELTREHYVALHREAPDRWPEAFRGFRSHALSDPLAYWVGAAERRRLGAAAGASTQPSSSGATCSAPARDR